MSSAPHGTPPMSQPGAMPSAGMPQNGMPSYGMPMGPSPSYFPGPSLSHMAAHNSQHSTAPPMMHAPPSMYGQQSAVSYGGAPMNPYGGTPAYGGRPLTMNAPMGSMGGNVAGVSQHMSQASMGIGGSGLVVSINLEMHAVGLKDRDLIGKSDPMCSVFVPDEPQHLGIVGGHMVRKWRMVGRTEMVENTTSPSWVNRVRVQFHFEQHQPLKFEVVDVDNRKTLKGNNLGHAVVTLAEIVRNGMLRLKLTSGRGKGNWGELTVRAHDDNQGGKVRLRLSLAGKGLDKKDLMGKSDPYYVIRQVLSSGGASSVYKSKEIKNSCNPTWEPHTLKISSGRMPWQQVQLQASVYDWDKYTPHDHIGNASFTLNELATTSHFDLINPKKAGKSRKYKNSGQLVIHRADVDELPNFVSYLQGGLRLDFTVAVDFTASNRPVNNPASLHFINDPQRPSQYAQALFAVGTILSPYIPNGYMTALGFGAILPGGGNTACFDFALSGQPDPRVHGVQGLLHAYEQAANNVQLAGPTNFTPLIRNAMNLTSMDPVSQTNQHFTILLILTDGIITDLSSTIEAIVECSYSTPMAIVIVGIGGANFSSMERLDGDQYALRTNSGRQAKHDIVQFTKFDRNKSNDVLAADVLQEVPDRVVEFMVDAGIKPNPQPY